MYDFVRKLATNHKVDSIMNSNYLHELSSLHVVLFFRTVTYFLARLTEQRGGNLHNWIVYIVGTAYCTQ